MSDLYLHIGLPKTGSTVIQEFLWLNREQLATKGWRYPDFFRSQNHAELVIIGANDQHLLSTQFRKITSQQELDSQRASAVGDLATHTTDGSNWVMSSEHLGSRLTSVEEIDRLAEALGHFDRIRPVMWVRPQDEVAVSSHSTWVLDGNPAPFDINAHMKLDARYDYKQIAQRWEFSLGEDAVEVRLYSGRDLLADLVSSMGIGPLDQWAIPERANVSLTNVEVELLRQMNERLPRWSNGRPDNTHGNFHKVVAESGRGEKLRMSDDHRRLLLEKFAAPNQWILERAVNAAGLETYFDPPTSDDPGNVDVELSVDDALELSAELWRKTRRIQKRFQREKRKSESR